MASRKARLRVGISRRPENTAHAVAGSSCQPAGSRISPPPSTCGAAKRSDTIAMPASARAGRYRDTAVDGRVPYPRTVPGFLGMTDVGLVHGEGLAPGAPAEAQALLQDAEAQIEAAPAA